MNSSSLLLDRPALDHYTVRIRAVTRFPGWAKAIRTTEFNDIAFAFGELIGKSVKKSSWCLGLITEACGRFACFHAAEDAQGKENE